MKSRLVSEFSAHPLAMRRRALMGVALLALVEGAGGVAARSALCRQRAVLRMAADDGKPAKAARVGRVSSDAPLSVRKQIALVKAFKEAQSSGPSKPKERTSFRRVKKDGASEAAASGGDATGSSEPAQLPLLFVDGYNVIGYWARLKKRRDNGDMASARDLLLSDLVECAPPAARPPPHRARGHVGAGRSVCNRANATPLRPRRALQVEFSNDIRADGRLRRGREYRRRVRESLRR